VRTAPEPTSVVSMSHTGIEVTLVAPWPPGPSPQCPPLTFKPRCHNRRRMRKPRHPAPPSPLADALAQVGDRWTLLAVAALLDGPMRFNELQEELRGIAPNVLSARLKALTEHALVVARPYSDRPPRFVYELSDSGRELGGALRLLADWGARSAGGGEPLRHSVCGTALEARWWCPACEQPVDDPDAEDEVVHV
jgi:DNA-binding HxlR family transcriptional regulator